ncbi:MAG: thiamine-phosphate kinase, partial [Planctomycetes bacterium]|nr:thiamine-phosphate kinase [Planctomycetota bacterium]
MRELDLIAYIQNACQAVGAGDLGIGDDACVWQSGERSCLSVDAIIENKHFTKEDDPRLIGRKAAAAALSDIAAMGGKVEGAALVYYMADNWDHQQVIDGFISELKRHDCPLYGGDTVAAEVLSLSVTVWG